MLKPIIARLKAKGMRVSLFADGDGDEEAVKLAKATGADRIEPLHRPLWWML